MPDASSTRFARSSAVARVRDQIDHPIVDGDGHILEFLPLVFDFVREEAGEELVKRLRSFNQRRFTTGVGFLPVRVFNGLPAEHTLDRMTVMLPNLLYNRLDEIGIDFALLYPSFGLTLLGYPDDEIRQVTARALNRSFAETFAGLRDRLEPVAVIPTYSPEEAIAELDHAVGELGLKAVVMTGAVPRGVRPDGTETAWIDTLGHESLYNYDPVWQRCVELGVVPTFHGIGYGWGTRVSSKNYVHNHLGNFATAQEGVCRSMLMGGVFSRFPTLRAAYLEGGAAWACQLYADLLGHYDKRNRDIVGLFDEARLDVPASMVLFDEYATGAIADRRALMEKTLTRAKEISSQTAELGLDDFAEAQIEGPDDIVDVFTRRLYFGCEADDPMNALAFNRRMLPHEATINAMFASDIGHWDVPDVTTVLPEAFELVEDGHISETEFAAFAYGNVTSMLTSMNPRFFDDTVLADQVK